MTHQTVEGEALGILKDVAHRFVDCAQPLLIGNEKDSWRLTLSVFRGLKRAKRNLQLLAECEIPKLSDEEYGDIVKYHDFVVSINPSPNLEKISYLPLDIKNSGAYTFATHNKPLELLQYFDVYVVMDLPGCFPQLIRMIQERSEQKCKD